MLGAVKEYIFSLPGVLNPQEPGLHKPVPVTVAVAGVPQVTVPILVQGSGAPAQLVHCTVPVWHVPSVPHPAVVL